jgi:hypothetical protein
MDNICQRETKAFGADRKSNSRYHTGLQSPEKTSDPRRFAYETTR